MASTINGEKTSELGEVIAGEEKDAEAAQPLAWHEKLINKAKNLFAGNKKSYSEYMTKAAVKGRFRITVNERGFLDSQRNETLTCKVPGSTTIISIVAEGTVVKKGDVVCELDSSSLEDKARQQEIDVTQSQAAMANAKENLAIQKTQNESDIAIAELKLEFAKLDLKKYIEGELPQEKDKILGQIQLKEEQLTRKIESYAFIKRMTKKGYRTPSDLEAERLSVTQAEIDLKVQKENMRVLENYTAVRKLAAFEADAKELERELERTIRKTAAALAKSTADLESRTLTAKVEKEKYDDWLNRIENCIMHAPQDGEIVYAKSTSNRRSSSEPEIEVGSTVRERQPIINIPDVTVMKIDAKIHESMISPISVGQPVTVHVNARPNESFEGRVAEISSVPLSGSFPNYDIKEYQVAINLTDSADHVSLLRPGLSAEFEIIVEDRMDVLQIPVQSVVQMGRDYYCWVLSASGTDRRKLKLGGSNDTDIEILDGIEEGEVVVMNPRTNFSDEIKMLEENLSLNADDNPVRKAIDPRLMESANPQASPRGGSGKPSGQRPSGQQRGSGDKSSWNKRGASGNNPGGKSGRPQRPPGAGNKQGGGRPPGAGGGQGRPRG